MAEKLLKRNKVREIFKNLNIRNTFLQMMAWPYGYCFIKMYLIIFAAPASVVSSPGQAKECKLVFCCKEDGPLY